MRFFSKFLTILTNPKFIVVLIILTLTAAFIGVTVPQIGDKSPSYFKEWEVTSPKTYYVVNLLQFNRVYTSVWFLALVSIIGMSLLITVWDQWSAAIKAYKYRGRPILPERLNNFSTLTVPETSKLNTDKTIKGVLRSNGFKICNEDRNEHVTFVFSKNGIGRFGGAILHAGFLFVIVAALYNLAFHQRGFVQLIETETFSGRNRDWLESNHGLLAKDFNLDFQTHLKRFIPQYWENDRIRSLQSELTIMDETGMKDMVLSISSPVQYKGVTLYQFLDYGYTLTFVLTRQTRQIVTHFSLDKPHKKDKPLYGRADFPITDYVLDMKFYPNLFEPSFYLGFPGVDLSVSEKGKVLFNGRVLFDQQVNIGNDTLRFAQIHYWSGISFVRNSGLTLIYIGFVISTIGAFLIYFVVYKEIHIKIAKEGDKTLVKIGGRARKYQTLFADEFEQIFKAIGDGLR